MAHAAVPKETLPAGSQGTVALLAVAHVAMVQRKEPELVRAELQDAASREHAAAVVLVALRLAAVADEVAPHQHFPVRRMMTARIAASTVVDSDMAKAINPLVRWGHPVD